MRRIKRASSAVSSNAVRVARVVRAPLLFSLSAAEAIENDLPVEERTSAMKGKTT